MSLPVGEGSWELKIKVTDVDIERSLRVKGDMHVGGVIFNLVDLLKIPKDWSDHGLWWPQKNQWLSKTKFTLDQYSVTAEAELYFTPMHKAIRVQLPDLRYIDCRIDFSANVFKSVCDLCKELGIRYPEELSFQKPIEADDLKFNYGDAKARRKKSSILNSSRPISPDTNTYIVNSTLASPNHHTVHDRSPYSVTPVKHSPIVSPINTTLRDRSYQGYANGSMNSHNLSLENGLDMSLAQSPQPINVELAGLNRPKTIVEKARMNVSWLDSSLSAMEQGVQEYDTLLMRFKFFAFYDLNPKYDLVRISQLYEQAKWAILNEEIDCTEEEMLMFSALQLQVNLQAHQPQPSLDEEEEDDVGNALDALQSTLEGTHVTSGEDITHIPELGDYLRFLKPKRFTLKGWKRLYFVMKDISLYAWKAKADSNSSEKPVVSVSLQGCEVTPDVNLSQGRFGIKLEVLGAEGMQEMLLRCHSEDNYAQWMAACRLASKGKTMADSSYKAEVDSIKAFLSMQRPAETPIIHPDSISITPEHYAPPKYLKKLRGKLERRILEAHGNVKNLNLVNAKMQYIKAWQSLPDYGVSLFVVKFMNAKKEELLGIAFNRLMRMDINTGDHIKTWRYNKVKAWNVNWDLKHMMVQLEDESVVFSCLSADCKVVHEFIGGYIFLSTRSKDASQQLDEELFHKLTRGW